MVKFPAKVVVYGPDTTEYSELCLCFNESKEQDEFEDDWDDVVEDFEKECLDLKFCINELDVCELFSILLNMMENKKGWVIDKATPEIIVTY